MLEYSTAQANRAFMYRAMGGSPLFGAERTRLVVIAKRLRRASPPDDRAKRLFGVASAQMVLELGLEPDPGLSRLAATAQPPNWQHRADSVKLRLRTAQCRCCSPSKEAPQSYGETAI